MLISDDPSFITWFIGSFKVARNFGCYDYVILYDDRSLSSISRQVTQLSSYVRGSNVKEDRQTDMFARLER